ncbi:DNA cytosine methyltransferase [Rhizobium leguminosarum]|uniref:DNA cytosine methyltransferase n=1 Tax=Rhizobium leguminosarum TaxID=384 RepID=UPI00103E94FA|nr:DNA cytosine methyltransferase [Rhizobium leguminosarum]TBY27426.1 DNA cytosine methyltransferase [Rhizobium leguminosarum bv. viciae]
MTKKKEETPPSIDEIALRRTASEIRSINDVILKSYLHAADTFSMLNAVDPALVDAYLMEHAGLAREDIERLRKLSAAMDGQLREHLELLVQSRVSLRAIDALADAHEDVQASAVKLLDGGKVLRADEVAVLSELRQTKVTPEWMQWEQHRSSTLESLAQPAVKEKIASLETKALAVVDELHRFDECWSDGTFDEYKDMYEECHRSLVTKASLAFIEFEDVIGTGESLLALGTEDATYLAASYFALGQVSEGRFGYGYGLSLRRDLGIGDLQLADALRELVPFDEYTQSVPRKVAPLKVLELCAGGGGMALGLQAAGFQHLALYDNYKPAIKTLKTNQPHWPVRHRDVTNLTDEELASFGHVDLLAAGLPCGPGERIKRRPDLHPRMTEILRLLQPSSFIFESDAGARKKPGLMIARTEAVAAMAAAGYVVMDFSLDTAEYGLPHSTRRDFIVGIRADMGGVFAIPKVHTKSIEQKAEAYKKAKTKAKRDELDNELPGYRRGLQKANILSLFTSHEILRSSDGKSEAQRRYDSWAKEWRGKFGETLLPDIPMKQEKRAGRVGGWPASGFDRSWIVETPPTVKDVGGSDDKAFRDFKPRLTFAALAAAQGFPVSWRFMAGGDERLPMIQAALPPVVAKMVGLALRTALTGETFDLDREVELAVIQDAKVGPQPRKPPSLRERLRRNRYLPRTKIYEQAVRVLNGEDLKIVEPNRLLRRPIKEMMPLVRAELARIEAEYTRREDDGDHDPSVISGPCVMYAPTGSRFAKKAACSSDREEPA